MSVKQISALVKGEKYLISKLLHELEFNVYAFIS